MEIFFFFLKLMNYIIVSGLYNLILSFVPIAKEKYWSEKLHILYVFKCKYN